jgi:catechol 2,3-dioxygenase-like lactoylglutathione lyase family enzyme
MTFLKITPRLPVADLARTIAFYSDLLGFQVGALWPQDEPTFAILNRDDVNLQFCLDEQRLPGTLGHATINIEVNDGQAMHDRLAGRLKVEWGPEVYWYGRREFAIRDPDGYLIIFTEETDDPPTCDDG